MLPVIVTVPATAAPPAVGTRVNVVVFSVDVVIGSENVTSTGSDRETAIAPDAGVVEVTVGGVTSGAAPVVNVQLKFAASALPAASFTAVVIVARNCVLPARFAPGTKVAVLPVTETEPPIAGPPATGDSDMLAAVIVEFVNGSENVAEIAVFSPTAVAPFKGVFAMTVGGVTSGAAAVVKDQL